MVNPLTRRLKDANDSKLKQDKSGDASALIVAQRSLEARFSEIINVLDYGAKADGITDDTSALSAAWAALKATFNSSRTSVRAKLIVPPGRYLIAGSVNWGATSTTFLAWNVHIEAEGAVFIGQGVGKAVVNMAGVRGVHLKGLHIYGDPAFIPSTGLLLGNIGTQTSGNNRISNVIANGYYSIAAGSNVGSETTSWDFCYFMNNNPAASAWAFVGDGSNRLGLTSDYAPLRAVGVPVSFTNNRFSGCRFQKDVAGPSFYLESSQGWQFDRDCYFLAFDNSNVIIRNSTSSRNNALRLAGLFETTQGAGVKYAVTLIQPDGDAVVMNDILFDLATPHASVAMIRLARESDYTNLTSGTFALRACQINCSGFYGATPVPLFTGAFITFSGEIRCADARQINLASVLGFDGIVHTNNWFQMTQPPAGSTGMCIDQVNQTRMFGDFGVAGDISALNAPRRLKRSAVAWAVGQTVKYGDVRVNNTALRIYRCVNVGGTTSGTAPVHNVGAISGADGISWQYLGTDLSSAMSCFELENDGSRMKQRVLHEIISSPGSFIHEYSDIGTPEGKATAPVGSRYFRTDGSTGTTLYVKENGTGPTGWVAK